MHVNEQYDYLLESFLCIMFICTYKCITIVCCELVLTSFTWCSTLWALLTTFDHFAGQQFPSLGQCKVWAANAMHESKSNLNIQIMEQDPILEYPIFWSWCFRKYTEESDDIISKPVVMLGLPWIYIKRPEWIYSFCSLWKRVMKVSREQWKWVGLIKLRWQDLDLKSSTSSRAFIALKSEHVRG